MPSQTDRYLILATDPDEVDWTILFQTDDHDKALDFWSDNQGDPSHRILINTGDFITFEPESSDSDES